MADLEGHPAVQPKVLDFLSHNAAPKEMLELLRALIRQTQTSLAGHGGRGGGARGDQQPAQGDADRD